VLLVGRVAFTSRCTGWHGTMPVPPRPHREYGMTIRAQVEKLLAQMTPAEKAGQLTQYFYFRLPEGAEPVLDFDADEQPKIVESKLQEGVTGSLLFVTDPAEINRLQRLAVEGNRLGIPVLFGFDVIHGLRTIFPVPIAMAASWDPETIEAGQVLAAR
jgi:beta-glucosidase